MTEGLGQNTLCHVGLRPALFLFIDPAIHSDLAEQTSAKILESQLSPTLLFSAALTLMLPGVFDFSFRFCSFDMCSSTFHS